MAAPKLHMHIELPPLVDDPLAPQIYADNFAGLVFNQGNLNLTFAATQADHTKDPAANRRMVTGRLVMPATALADLHTNLGHFLKDLEAKGLIKTAPTLQVVQ